jgi:hypothetical protein
MRIGLAPRGPRLKLLHLMNRRWIALLAASALMMPGAHAADGASCDGKLTSQLAECERIVGSLRPDKAGQMRVFASDGSVFTAGQAQWMKEQLKLAAQSCSDGDGQQASHRLAQVQQLLKEHQAGG